MTSQQQSAACQGPPAYGPLVPIQAWQTSPFREGFDWASDARNPPGVNPWQAERPAALFELGRAAAAHHADWRALKRSRILDGIAASEVAYTRVGHLS
jgi:hypothetical protein